MSPAAAAKLLEIPESSTPDQIEARFLELRAKLEDKIAKAPTPGLKAKYRENLDEITLAFETLTLAADSSELPVLKKQEAVSDKPSAVSAQPVGSPLAGGPAASGPRPQQAGSPAAKPKASNKEFLLVAVIAILVLVGGGWFVMKTRAENAEKERVAAEVKAAAEQKAAADKAEKERLAEEARQAEAAKQAAALEEKNRVEKLAAQVRVKFSETKLLWEQAQRAQREAERTLTDLQGNLRSARDLTPGQRRLAELRVAAQADYSRWLAEFLGTHPARRAEVRTEELLNARQIDAAATALADYQRALADLDTQIASRRPDDDALFGSVAITTEPAGVSWQLSDSFGATASGETPAAVPQVGVGAATVTFRRAGWADKVVNLNVAAKQEARAAFVYRPASLRITSSPAGAEVLLDKKPAGRTPLTISDLPEGTVTIDLRLAEHKAWSQSVPLNAGQSGQVEATLNLLTDEEFVAECTTRWAGTWVAMLRDTPVYCQFEAGATTYVEWNGTGKLENRRFPCELQLASRNPVVLNRILSGRVSMYDGQPVLLGSFIERDGQLIYQSRSMSGTRTADSEMKRTNQ